MQGRQRVELGQETHTKKQHGLSHSSGNCLDPVRAKYSSCSHNSRGLRGLRLLGENSQEFPPYLEAFQILLVPPKRCCGFSLFPWIHLLFLFNFIPYGSYLKRNSKYPPSASAYSPTPRYLCSLSFRLYLWLLWRSSNICVDARR